jgi:hypothetical protein
MKNTNEKKNEQNSKKTMNYNDRLDGYGFGEADAEVDHDAVEKGTDKEEHQKYGPVDQYSFRVAPLGDQKQEEEKTERDINQDP